MATKSKKMSNEGHATKVSHGGSIGLVFLIGMIVGCVVVFFAVAGRTQAVIEQRRELYKEKLSKEAALKSGPAEAAPLAPSNSPAATDTSLPSSGKVIP